MIKIGNAEGKCSRCGKIHSRPRPMQSTICSCYKYCPLDHGRGVYGTEMEPYVPDMTASTYGPIVSEGSAWGDLEHPMSILFRCSACNYHSAQEPVEVELT